MPLACDEALDRHLSLISHGIAPDYKLKKTPSSRISLARKVYFDKAMLDSSGSFSRELSVERPTIRHDKSDAKVESPSETSIEKDEKTQEITPLKKSTPKRNRRLVRGKLREKEKIEKESGTKVSPRKPTEASGKDAAACATPKKTRRLPAKMKKSAAVVLTPIQCTSNIPGLSDSLTSSSDATNATLHPPKKITKNSDKEKRLSESGHSVDSADKNLEESNIRGSAGVGSTGKFDLKRRADEDILDSTRKKLRRTEPDATPEKGVTLTTTNDQTPLKPRSDSVKKRGSASASKTPSRNVLAQSDTELEKGKGRRLERTDSATSSTNTAASSEPDSDSAKKSAAISHPLLDSGKAKRGRRAAPTSNAEEDPPDSSSVSGSKASGRKGKDVATPSTSADRGSDSMKKRSRRRVGDVVSPRRVGASSDFSSDSGRKPTRSTTPGKPTSSPLLASGEHNNWHSFACSSSHC